MAEGPAVATCAAQNRASNIIAYMAAAALMRDHRQVADSTTVHIAARQHRQHIRRVDGGQRQNAAGMALVQRSTLHCDTFSPPAPTPDLPGAHALHTHLQAFSTYQVLPFLILHKWAHAAALWPVARDRDDIFGAAARHSVSLLSSSSTGLAMRAADAQKNVFCCVLHVPQRLL